MKLRTLLLLAFLVASTPALAHIPPYWMIMSRVAENNGRGVIQVEQDLVFRHQNEPQVISERWFIENENRMRLEVTGKRQMKDVIRMTIIYDGERKYFIDENGVRKTDRLANDWLEPYFHFRFSRNIRPMLVAQNIAPTASLKSAPHKYSEKDPFPPKEDYVRLSRTGGVVNYAISAKPQEPSNDLAPGIWIEQDQFVVRKLRLKSGLNVRAEEYKEYSAKLFLPRLREVSFGDHKVEIQITSVKSVPNNAKTKELFAPAGLDFGKNPSYGRILPEDAVIREFYARAR